MPNDAMRGAVAQAGAIAAASALRYGSALAEIQSRYQSALMRALVERDGSDQRELADDLRSWLREIGEAANQEARRLQAELDRLSEMIAQILAADGAADGPEPRARQHRAKE